MDLYFAYGSNMSTPRLHARVASADPIGKAFVDDWLLVFNKPGVDGSGKANLVDSPGARTWGVLFELSTTALAGLDRFEPSYERRPFRLERPNGSVLIAESYLYEPPTSVPANPPTVEYLAHLLAGAREHSLPEDYIARIESHRPKPA